jgi:hypothetical protein
MRSPYPIIEMRYVTCAPLIHFDMHGLARADYRRVIQYPRLKQIKECRPELRSKEESAAAQIDRDVFNLVSHPKTERPS